MILLIKIVNIKGVKLEIKTVSRRHLGNLHLEMSGRQFETQVCGQVFKSVSSKVRRLDPRCFAKHVKQTLEIITVLRCLFCITHSNKEKNSYSYTSK